MNDYTDQQVGQMSASYVIMCIPVHDFADTVT